MSEAKYCCVILKGGTHHAPRSTKEPPSSVGSLAWVQLLRKATTRCFHHQRPLWRSSSFSALPRRFVASLWRPITHTAVIPTTMRITAPAAAPVSVDRRWQGETHTPPAMACAMAMDTAWRPIPSANALTGGLVPIVPFENVPWARLGRTWRPQMIRPTDWPNAAIEDTAIV